MPHLFFIICSLLVIAYLIKYNWQRRHLYALASKLNGPVAFPLIGSSYVFFGSVDSYLLRIVKILRSFKSPVKFWLGPSLIISFDNPEHIQKILSSNKVTDKHDVYNFLKPYGGEGLITGSGTKWKAGRKLIKPLYNAQFVGGALETFTPHVNILIKRLEKYIESDQFCVLKLIHACVVDIVGETILGVEFKSQEGESLDLVNAIRSMYDTVTPRIWRPWLYSDMIYNCTNSKKQQNQQVAILNNYFGNIAKMGLEAHTKQLKLELEKKRNYQVFIPSLHELSAKFWNNDENLSDDDFRDNLFTLFAASEDTVSVICASACVCFGMHPEYQDKAFEEVHAILQNSPRPIDYNDIAKMTYLDMCVKDVLRLFPIAPFIMRKTSEEFEIDKWKIPPNCAILIPIFIVHLDPTSWQRPMEFYPEHFLPENVEKRSPFSYLPFSAGPRGCIGKTLAQSAIKVILAKILQRFTIEAEGSYDELFKQLRADISVRSKKGYVIKLRERNCGQ